jgi:predicted DNA-binding transcriptional regulator AlpA
MTVEQLEESEFLSVSQLARACQVSESLIWSFVKSGEVPVVRMNRRVLVPRNYLRALVESATAEQVA